jgi:hypothetical protein
MIEGKDILTLCSHLDGYLMPLHMQTPPEDPLLPCARKPTVSNGRKTWSTNAYPLNLHRRHSAPARPGDSLS